MDAVKDPGCGANEAIERLVEPCGGCSAGDLS